MIDVSDREHSTSVKFPPPLHASCCSAKAIPSCVIIQFMSAHQAQSCSCADAVNLGAPPWSWVLRQGKMLLKLQGQTTFHPEAHLNNAIQTLAAGHQNASKLLIGASGPKVIA